MGHRHFSHESIVFLAHYGIFVIELLEDNKMLFESVNEGEGGRLPCKCMAYGVKPLDTHGMRE